MTKKLLVLLLGSNLGNRSGNLQHARLLIEESIGPIGSVSSIYETAPWGFDSLNPFLNQCISIWSDMDPVRILENIHLIESLLGREVRSTGYADRSMDIDILLYGDMIFSSPDLKIPHEKIKDRLFSLVPLAEILPDLVHPVFRKKISTLLSECLDDGKITRIPTD